jgi:2-phospho-L-lactate guanylyltransferase
MPAPAPDPATVRYAALVPVKPPAFGKSRLSDLGDAARRDLATAFAVDTVVAALACELVERVLVVTDDHELARGLGDLGVDVLPDGISEDLNGTLRLAAAELHRRSPGLRLLALCADLPSLRPDELASALAEASARPLAFVADADGVGTTAVMASGVATFAPAFGPSSRQRHLDAGAHEIDGSDVPTLRRDVDDPAALHDALALGVGPRTALVATLLGLRARSV